MLLQKSKNCLIHQNWPVVRVLTKSSPESAPTEVMDSLLMVRGMRTPLRGAVAASSAIFFFNLANIFSFEVSPLSYQHLTSQSPQLLASEVGTVLVLQCNHSRSCHFVASGKGKETIIKLARLEASSQQSHSYIGTKMTNFRTRSICHHHHIIVNLIYFMNDSI